jgi:hypothetical protein
VLALIALAKLKLEKPIVPMPVPMAIPTVLAAGMIIADVKAHKTQIDLKKVPLQVSGISLLI